MEKYNGIQLCDDVHFDLNSGVISGAKKKNTEERYVLCPSTSCSRMTVSGRPCTHCGAVLAAPFKSKKTIKAQAMEITREAREGRERWVKSNRPPRAEQNKLTRECKTLAECIALYKTWGYMNPGYARIKFDMHRGIMPGARRR
jgi:hypothetical protein